MLWLWTKRVRVRNTELVCKAVRPAFSCQTSAISLPFTPIHCLIVKNPNTAIIVFSKVRTWNQVLISVFNSIQEAREVPWAPRSKWGTPSRSRLDQGFTACHSLDLTSGVTTKLEPWFRINFFHQRIRIHLIPLRYHVMIIPCRDN